MAILEDGIEHIYIFAVIWSLCCTTNADGRVRFNVLIRKIIAEQLSHIKFPAEATIYNYKFNL